MTSAGIQIMSGENVVSLTPSGIDLTGSTVSITADAEVSITASTITLTGGMVNIN
jgi:adhesin HecA-like repeat protein